MYKVNTDGIILYAKHGEILSDVLACAGKLHQASCIYSKACRKCAVTVDGVKTPPCQYRITKDISVSLIKEQKVKAVVGTEESHCYSENMCYVLDIGTTTLALALVSLDTTNTVKVITADNPQRSFGFDVISRIKYCSENSVAALFQVLKNKISDMVKSFSLQKELDLYVAGNVTMLHTFFGIDCSSLGIFPYTPKFLSARKQKSFIDGVSEIHSLPSVHTFVGADIVAGMNYASLPGENKYNILIDLGTNAEIVLYSQNHALCTSAAAGPCFEAANISCGMGASGGAIYEYCNGGFRTIENLPPAGICGTGLIDIIAHLLKTGKIDQTGYLKDNVFDIADNVYVTDRDIRQYQLAKSAVYSAVVTLIDMEKISESDIESLYISGGFSCGININNAVLTGLFPVSLSEKCIGVNNSSLLGSIKYAIEKNPLDVFVKNTEYVDLSTSDLFSELFIKNMNFPV